MRRWSLKYLRTCLLKGVKTSSLKLKAVQTLTAPKPPKHGSVKFRVTTAAYELDGVRYPAASASRKFRR